MQPDRTFISKVYGLSDKLTFGKFKDCTIRSVIEVQPSYVDWAIKNVKGFALDDAASILMDAKLAEKRSIRNVYYDLDDHWDRPDWDDGDWDSWR